MTNTSVRGHGEQVFTDAELAQVRRVLDAVDAAWERRDRMPWRQRVAAYVVGAPDATPSDIARMCGVSRKHAVAWLEGKDA